MYGSTTKPAAVLNYYTTQYEQKEPHSTTTLIITHTTSLPLTNTAQRPATPYPSRSLLHCLLQLTAPHDAANCADRNLWQRLYRCTSPRLLLRPSCLATERQSGQLQAPQLSDCEQSAAVICQLLTVYTVVAFSCLVTSVVVYAPLPLRSSYRPAAVNHQTAPPSHLNVPSITHSAIDTPTAILPT